MDLLQQMAAIDFEELQEVETAQWVAAVTAFSSQYGTGDANWGACSIVGPHRFYPAYGDSQKAWAPTTQNGTEFVELKFDKAVVAKALHVYETYNPGALVKVSARVNGEYVSLWEGKPDTAVMATGKSRIFEVPLCAIGVPIAEVRLDIDATTWSNWYEIDAVSLVGTATEYMGHQYKKPEPGTLAGDMLTLLDSDGDVEFITSDGIVKRAHSCILQARCPELVKSRTTPVRVPFHSSVLNALLVFCYSDDTQIPAVSALPIYVCARHYGCKGLMAKAITKFSAVITAKNVCQLLTVAADIPGARTACLQYLVSHPISLVSSLVNSLNKQDLAELTVLLAAAMVKPAPK